MNLLEPLTELLGITKRTEASVTALTQKLSASETQVSTLQAENTRLAGESAAKGAQVDKLTADNSKLASDLKTANEAVAAKEADVERRAALKASEIVAGQGAPPVKPEAKANPKGDNTEVSQLKGRAKMEAATKAQTDAWCQSH